MIDPTFPPLHPSDMFPGCEAARIETDDGIVVVLRLAPDNDQDPPWKSCDGHGPVREVRFGYRDGIQKSAGERVLYKGPHHTVLYDFAEACRMARRDGWGFDGKSAATHIAEGKSARQVAAEAAERDFKYLRAYCEDRWTYVGVVVIAFDAETEVELSRDSLWGVEAGPGLCPDGGAEYVGEVAGGMLGFVLDEVREARRALVARLSKHIATTTEET